MTRKWDLDAIQLNNEWHVAGTIGPFKTREEAVELCRRIAALALKEEAPPPLGINVSETITAADKFG